MSLTRSFVSLQDNEAAFDRYKLRPRVLVNVETVVTETEILGTKVSLPFGFSPTASHKLAHPEGELATSRAAAKFGICMGLSSYSTYALEDVIKEENGNPYAIQMCVLRDRSLTLQLLERAESRCVLVSTRGGGMLTIGRGGLQGTVPVGRRAGPGSSLE